MAIATKYVTHFLWSSDPLEEWDQFVEESPQGCIFCRSWWLAAVCPGRFRILTLRKGGRIVAGMPLVVLRKLGQRIVHMPPLTQTLGVLLGSPTKQSYGANLSSEMEVLNSVVNAMPRFHLFSANFHYSFGNWLPFYWAGYQQTTRYTYVFDDITDPKKVFSRFAHSKRKNIKKAEKLVTVHRDLPAKDFHAHHKMTLLKQGARISYGYDVFSKVYEASHSRDSGKTWYAVGSEGAIHAAIFVVYDKESAYYLVSSIDPDYSSSGSTTLLLREAIAYLSGRTKRFDLEGSMIQSVEQSFRRLGAVQTPYFKISKDNRSLFAKCFFALGQRAGQTLRRLGLRR